MKEDLVYSAGQFPYSYFYPFLEAFDNLRVVARYQDAPQKVDTDSLNLASGENISFQLLPNINSPQGLLKNYFTVKNALQEELKHVDGVIIRSVSDMGWLLYKLAKKANKPIAMEMAACAWDSTWNHGNRYGKIYAPIRYMRDKAIIRNADYVLYVSQSFLQERYPTNAQTVFASNVRIERPSNEILDKKLERIKMLYDHDAPIVIGLIGTLKNKLKGVRDALRAIARIEKSSRKQIIFRVLGPGEPDEFRALELQLGMTSEVHYDGIIQSGEGVLEWLNNIDIYIQPSYQEGVPRATIEAMSRANPVIGSTAGGIPELISTKWLHKPGDVQGLSNLLQNMIDNPEDQISSANQNFETSSRYVSDILMPKRISFWKDFAKFSK